MSYFEALQQDWDTLGLFSLKRENSIESTVLPKDINTYNDLHAMLHGLGQNVSGSDYEINNHMRGADPSTLRTELAKHAVSLCRLDLMRRLPLYICGQAEPLITRSMQPDRIADGTKDSPVIIIRDDKPVGIVKQLGDINYYALEDDPDTTTHAGHLYRTHLQSSHHRPFERESQDNVDYYRKLTSDHAFYMPLEDLKDNITNGTQFSMFMIPLSERKDLIVDGPFEGRGDELRKQEALQMTHDILRELAERALTSAERLYIGRKYHPESLRSGLQEVKINGKYVLVEC